MQYLQQEKQRISTQNLIEELEWRRSALEKCLVSLVEYGLLEIQNSNHQGASYELAPLFSKLQNIKTSVLKKPGTVPPSALFPPLGETD